MVDDFRPQPQRPTAPAQPNNNPVEGVGQNEYGSYDHDPDTYVPVHPQVTVAKKRGGVLKWLFGALLVILFGVLLAALYMKWTEAESASKELNSTQAQLRTTENELAKAKADAKSATAKKATDTTAAKTTAELANDLTAAYKAAVTNNAYVPQVTVKGDYVTVLVAKPNSDSTQQIVYKKAGDKLVAISEHGFAGLTAEDKAFLKTVYGYDPAVN